MTRLNTSRMSARKQDAQWLLEAAQKVDNYDEKHACSAIAVPYINYGPDRPDRWYLRDRYERLFSPTSGSFGLADWGEYWDDNAHDCRVLALLLARAMAQTGDL